MSDKKNDEYVVQMPKSSPAYGGEKDSFLGRGPSHRHGGQASALASKIEHSPPLSILAYCVASISMTVVNKYVVSGSDWNLNFFYLAIQVCTPHPELLTCGHIGN